jgi:DNA sulfur modification protein DndE
MMDRIVMSQRAREQLVQLKRKTGIRHWNVLCRWALATSLADPSKVSSKSHPADSNVEMTWRTFAGDQGDVYLALLQARRERDGFNDEPAAMTRHLRAHLHRGIGVLASRRDISDVRALFRHAEPVSG